MGNACAGGDEKRARSTTIDYGVQTGPVTSKSQATLTYDTVEIALGNTPLTTIAVWSADDGSRSSEHFTLGKPAQQLSQSNNETIKPPSDSDQQATPSAVQVSTQSPQEGAPLSPPPTSSASRRKSCRSLLREVHDALHQRVGEQQYFSEEESALVSQAQLLFGRLNNSPNVQRMRLLRSLWRRVVGKNVDRAADRVASELTTKHAHIAKLLYAGLHIPSQSKRFLAMITSSIEICDHPDEFVRHVTALGVRHAAYDSPPKYFDTLWTIARETLVWVIDTMPPEDSAAFSPEDVRSALHAFDELSNAMQTLMTQGMLSAEGVSLKKRMLDRVTFVLTTSWQAANVDHKMSRNFTEIGLNKVRTCKTVSEACLHRQQKIFIHFEKRYLNFQRVFSGVIVTRRDDESRAMSILREQGALHAGFNLEKEDFDIFTDTFHEALEASLGTQGFSHEVKVAWIKFWDFCMTHMHEGATAGMNDFRHSLAPRRAPFALIFTDIESSTKLWERDPPSMGHAVEVHHKLIRSLIYEHRGYEVKTVGDSFVIAFGSLVDATLFALHLQLNLMTADFGKGFSMVPMTQGLGPEEVWNARGLRVRVGINHCTEATPKYDPVRRYWDYYGPSVNMAARVEGLASGGQILMTDTTLAALRADPAFPTATVPHVCPVPSTIAVAPLPGQTPLNDEPVIERCAATVRLADVFHASVAASNVLVKGSAMPVDVISCVPSCLRARWFPTPEGSGGSVTPQMTLSKASSMNSPLGGPVM